MKIFSRERPTYELICIDGESGESALMPSWAEWFAIDNDGRLSAYETEPFINNEDSILEWCNSGGTNWELICTVDLCGKDWRETKTKIERN